MTLFNLQALHQPVPGWRFRIARKRHRRTLLPPVTKAVVSTRALEKSAAAFELLLLPLNLLLIFGVISTAADSRSETAQRRNLRLPLTFAFALALAPGRWRL
jgi:hypothetical protein